MKTDENFNWHIFQKFCSDTFFSDPGRALIL